MKNCENIFTGYSGGTINITRRRLESLVGCPEVVSGDFFCARNDELQNLVGGPKHVTGDYSCGSNKITSLEGCASHIGHILSCPDTNITSLVGIHKIVKSCQSIEFDCIDIKQGGIGLLLIENLTDISSEYAPFYIIKSYLGTGTKGMMACRAELISRGYEDYAKL